MNTSAIEVAELIESLLKMTTYSNRKVMECSIHWIQVTDFGGYPLQLLQICLRYSTEQEKQRSGIENMEYYSF